MNPQNLTPRLRMFAGPNGSGKSTIKSMIGRELLGVYVNPDEIEAEIRRNDVLDLRNYQFETNEKDILEFFNDSILLNNVDLLDDAARLTFNQGRLGFFDVEVNSYFASVAADFIRQKLLVSRQSFTFETVMSSPDKIELLRKTRQFSYRTYLYFVATDDPRINMSRVEHRVKSGGHDVPSDKIVARYYRSLDLLWDALMQTDRAYIFDNSGSAILWLAEITNAKLIETKLDNVPQWYKKYVLDKIV